MLPPGSPLLEWNLGSRPVIHGIPFRQIFSWIFLVVDRNEALTRVREKEFMLMEMIISRNEIKTCEMFDVIRLEASLSPTDENRNRKSSADPFSSKEDTHWISLKREKEIFFVWHIT